MLSPTQKKELVGLLLKIKDGTIYPNDIIKWLDEQEANLDAMTNIERWTEDIINGNDYLFNELTIASPNLLITPELINGHLMKCAKTGFASNSIRLFRKSLLQYLQTATNRINGESSNRKIGRNTEQQIKDFINS